VTRARADQLVLEGERMETSERYRVLVVDDFEHCAESIALLVEVLGHESRTATTARAAIDACGRFAPDLVLLDLGLPDMCGFEAVRILKACRPGVRVVAFTGWPDPEGLVHAFAAGAEEYIAKPINRRRIERLLSTTSTAV
jgi:DNA-binding response OmpR family regulator